MSTTTEIDNNNNNKVTYRAFHLGRKRRSPAYGDDEFFYLFADLYELHIEKHKLLTVNYRSHLNNPLEKHAVTIGEERRVSVITAPQYFSEKAASIGTSTDYMLVPTKLIKRRFLTILQFDIDQYKAENSSGTDPNTIFLEEPIPGIAPIREILTITREESLMHEVIAQWDTSEAKTEYDRHNYSISFEPVECFDKLYCSLHWSEVEHLPETQTFIIGASRYDPEVIAMNKKQSERRTWVKELQLWRDYLLASELFFVTDMFTEEEEGEEEEAN